jgi:hypothetical protein
MKDNLGKIEKVESIKNWEKVEEVMTPFGAIAEMYTKTLAYGIEIKRLDVEVVRIQEQSKIANNVIIYTCE